jgi:hypothetical protein
MGHWPKPSRWTACTTIRPDQTRKNIPIPAQERKQEMKFYLDTRTQPHPLPQPQPTTSKFAAQRKRNAKPSYAVYFQLLLLHLQKTNKETTSHPRPRAEPPSHENPDLQQIVLHAKQIAHQPTKRTGLQLIAHQPTKRTGLLQIAHQPTKRTAHWASTSDHGPLTIKCPCSRSINLSCCSGQIQPRTTHATPINYG